MHGPYSVEVMVKSVKGTCNFGHEVGDRIVLDGRCVKGEVCYSALLALLPRVYGLRFGAEYPWLKDKNIIETACPDWRNPVVFEATRRLEE